VETQQHSWRGLRQVTDLPSWGVTAGMDLIVRRLISGSPARRLAVRTKVACRLL
jgi:hypothetical protein